MSGAIGTVVTMTTGAMTKVVKKLTDREKVHTIGEMQAVFVQRSVSVSTVALSLCTATHPLHTRFAMVFGASVSGTTMRPNPRSVFLSFCLGPVMTIVVPFFTGQLREGDFGDMISNLMSILLLDILNQLFQSLIVDTVDEYFKKKRGVF